jgi:hypothetical protein
MGVLQVSGYRRTSKDGGAKIGFLKQPISCEMVSVLAQWT